jgi:hypothetical protein
MVVSSSANLYKATVMPEWLVWPSSFTVPVRMPVSGDVGCFEQETANRKRKKKVRKWREFARIVFWYRVRELRRFPRIMLRKFLMALIVIGYWLLSYWEIWSLGILVIALLIYCINYYAYLHRKYHDKRLANIRYIN